MQLKAQQLAAALQKKLAPIYYISGDEPQQLGEAADQIRSKARSAGYEIREILTADKAFDWKQINISADTFSIFSDKKIIDLRLGSSTFGAEGAKAIKAYCEHLSQDTLLLISGDKISKESMKTAWFQAIDKIGIIIQVWPLTGQEFYGWLQQKAHQRGITMTPEALKLLANQVEGNLLAAVQEIEKLYVLYGTAQITTQQIQEVVVDSSRYDVFKLVEAALSGNVNKTLKILNLLQSEDVGATLVLWALARECRTLIKLKSALKRGESKELLFKQNNLWAEHKNLVDIALKKLRNDELNHCLLLGAKADRQIKGQQTGDPWQTLLEMCLILGSVPMFSNAI